MGLWAVVVVVAAAASGGAAAEVLDLGDATVVVAPPQTPLARNAASTLQREVLRRTGVTLMVGDSDSAGALHHHRPTITLGARSGAEVDWSSGNREGYHISANSTGVTVIGSDMRGLLFGVGRLLRLLNLTLEQNYYTPRAVGIRLSVPLELASSPSRPMRGVQVGYRPKTNSYDGLTPQLFEQLVVDLALFGANQIELIPHSFDDAPYSPHFSLSHLDMNIAMSTILAKYGINVSLWYPACHPGGDPNKGCQKGDYNDKKVMEAAKADWHQVFSSMPRVDTLFINAGDPGGQNPEDLMMIAQAARKILLEYHPHAQLWICPQDYDKDDYARWASIAAKPETAAWMSGIIYGPGMPVPLNAFSNSTAPQRYPVRVYPDITHSLSDQLPVPNWDPVFHFAENRETVNPRPVTESAIAASQLALADAGVSSYDEGHHDDVNKHVWLAAAWGCDHEVSADVCSTDTVVRAAIYDWAKLHFDPTVATDAANLVYSLEQNWVGPLVGNPSINKTVALAQQILSEMPVRLRWNWRVQQLFYRVFYDKFLQVRASITSLGETSALAVLRAEAARDPTNAIGQAHAALDAADIEANVVSAPFYTELRVFAEAVFQSIHEQFSVPLYGAEYTRRGANLDLAMLPLSDAPFLRYSLQKIAAAGGNTSSVTEALLALANRKDPGPGGFYDDLGKVGAQPHYVHNPSNQTGDQSLWPSPVVEAASPSDQYYQLPPDQVARTKLGKKSLLPPVLPANITIAQLTWVGTTRPLTTHLPIQLRYEALPAHTKYSVIATGIEGTTNFTLSANGKWIWNGKSNLPSETPWKCDVPDSITAPGGTLTLAFTADGGMKVAEVWLRKRM